MTFPYWCEVWRHGKTERYIRQEAYAVVLLAVGGPTDKRKDDAGFTLKTEFPSKGGGDTVLKIFVDAGGYADLAAAMMQGAPDAAMKAFGMAIAGHAQEPTVTKRLVLPSPT